MVKKNGVPIHIFLILISHINIIFKMEKIFMNNSINQI